MAMNLPGEASAGATGDPEVMVDINTTPLIDVMLVLLIMLIITIPIQLHAVTLDLPVGTPPTPERPPEVIKIDVDAASTLYWQGVALGGAAELEQKMRAAANESPSPQIHLRPDRLARYEVVANVLASTRRLGLNKIGVIGGEQFVGTLP